MISISGLYESHLTVSDLDRSIAFFRDVVGLELAHTVPNRHATFFWVGGRERSMLGLWCVHSSPVRLRLHIAFSAGLEQVRNSVMALRSKGIVPRLGGGGPEIEEPAVIPWMPAASVYFDDPDGHSLEYIALLPHPPRPDIKGRIPLSVWEATNASGEITPMAAGVA